MVFCVGLAVLKYQEGLVTVGIEGEIVSFFSLIDRADRVSRDCDAQPRRILDTHAQEGVARSGHSA